MYSMIRRIKMFTIVLDRHKLMKLCLEYGMDYRKVELIVVQTMKEVTITFGVPPIKPHDVQMH
jgi:hypothetical protein